MSRALLDQHPASPLGVENKAKGGRDGQTDGSGDVVGSGLAVCCCDPHSGGEKTGEKRASVCGDVTAIVRNAHVQRRVARSQDSAVLACTPGFFTVENHWDTGSPLPNSSVWDVSGMIFAPLPFSGKETEGSGEFALLSFPLALYPLTNGFNALTGPGGTPKLGRRGGGTAKPTLRGGNGVCSAPKKPECLRLSR